MIFPDEFLVSYVDYRNHHIEVCLLVLKQRRQSSAAEVATEAPFKIPARLCSIERGFEHIVRLNLSIENSYKGQAVMIGAQPKRYYVNDNAG